MAPLIAEVLCCSVSILNNFIENFSPKERPTFALSWRLVEFIISFISALTCRNHLKKLSFLLGCFGHLSAKFSVGFTQNVQLQYNFAAGEIWLRDPADSTGTVWVWNFEGKEWYRFGGIAASLFFKNLEGIGFASGSDIFLFERTCTTDNGAPIDAYYKSAYLDFGIPEAPRRSMRAFLYASPGEDAYEVLFETEQKEESYRLLTTSSMSAPRLHDMRIATHRYRFLRFTLSVSASHPTEFYRLDIYSGP